MWRRLAFPWAEVRGSSRNVFKGHGLRVSIAVKRRYDHDDSYKGKHLLGMAYTYRSLVHYRHGEKHESIQADIVLEKELRVLYFDSQAAEGDCVPP